MTERELQEKIFKAIHVNQDDQILIDIEVPVPYRHIYLPGNPPNLEVWCFKQDIALYSVLYDKNVGYKDARISSTDSELVGLVLEKDSAQNTKHVALPYVAIELKVKQPTSDIILTCSKKAELIKSIFPFCQYMFLVFEHVAMRTYRHGLVFDEIVSLEGDLSDKNLAMVNEQVNKLYNQSLIDLANLGMSK